MLSMADVASRSPSPLKYISIGSPTKLSLMFFLESINSYMIFWVRPLVEVSQRLNGLRSSDRTIVVHGPMVQRKRQNILTTGCWLRFSSPRPSNASWNYIQRLISQRLPVIALHTIGLPTFVVNSASSLVRIKRWSRAHHAWFAIGHRRCIRPVPSPSMHYGSCSLTAQL